MTHPRDLLSAYLDHELTDQEFADVRRHLDDCDSCAAEVESIDRVRTCVRGLPIMQPPHPLVPAARRRRGRVRRFVAAATVAAAVLLAVVAIPQRHEVLDLNTLAGQHTARVVVEPGISMIRGAVIGP